LALLDLPLLQRFRVSLLLIICGARFSFSTALFASLFEFKR
jgi:hypothetical protein